MMKRMKTIIINLHGKKVWKNRVIENFSAFFAVKYNNGGESFAPNK